MATLKIIAGVNPVVQSHQAHTSDQADLRTGNTTIIYDNIQGITVEEDVRYTVINNSPANVGIGLLSNSGNVKGRFLFGPDAHSVNSELVNKINAGKADFEVMQTLYETVDLVLINGLATAGAEGSGEGYFIARGYCGRIYFYDLTQNRYVTIMTDHKAYIENDMGRTIQKVNGDILSFGANRAECREVN